MTSTPQEETGGTMIAVGRFARQYLGTVVSMGLWRSPQNGGALTVWHGQRGGACHGRNDIVHCASPHRCSRPMA